MGIPVGLLGDHGHCHRTQSHFALQRSDRDVQLCTRGYADHDLHPLGSLLSASNTDCAGRSIYIQSLATHLG